MTITVNGPNGITINFPDGTDSGTIESVMSEALGARKQQMVGFGERGQREQDMPLGDEGQYSLDVAKTAARKRRLGDEGWISTPKSVSGAFQGGAAQGLGDEMAGLAGGAAGFVKSAASLENPISGAARGYQVSRDAERLLQKEYAAEHPALSTAADLAGSIIAAPPMLRSPWGKGASLPATIVDNIKSGVPLAALQGFGQGEGLEDSLKQAGTSGATAFGLGVALPVAGRIGSIALSPLTSTARRFLNPNQEGAKAIEKAYQKDRALGAGMSDAEFTQHVQSGQPVIVADRGGEATRGLGRVAADESPEGRQALTNVLEPRYETQSERLSGTMNKESSLHGKASDVVTGGAAEDMVEAAQQAAQAANNKNYRVAYTKGANGIWDETLQQLVDSPTVQTALKRAISKAKDRNTLEGFGAFNPKVTLDEAGNIAFTGEKGLPAYPDLRLWDLTKRELDKMAGQAVREGTGDADIFAGFARKLRDHLDSLPEVGPAYQKARATAAEHFGAEDAFTAGRNFALQTGAAAKIQARHAMAARAQMSPKERELFKEGYIQAMRDKISHTNNRNNAARGLFESDAAKERGRIALGDEGLARVEAQLEIEKAMQATKEVILGGSKTFRYGQEAALAAAGGAGAAIMGDGNPWDLTLSAAALGATRYGRRLATDRMMKQVGRMLASQDPKEIDTLVKLAARQPKYLEAVRQISRRLTVEGGAGVGGAATQ